MNLIAWWEHLAALNLSPWVTLTGLDWYGHWSHCAAACQLPALALLEVLLNSGWRMKVSFETRTEWNRYLDSNLLEIQPLRSSCGWRPGCFWNPWGGPFAIDETRGVAMARVSFTWSTIGPSATLRTVCWTIKVDSRSIVHQKHWFPHEKWSIALVIMIVVIGVWIGPLDSVDQHWSCAPFPCSDFFLALGCERRLRLVCLACWVGHWVQHDGSIWWGSVSSVALSVSMVATSCIQIYSYNLEYMYIYIYTVYILCIYIYILYLNGRLNTPTLKVACLTFFPVWFGAGLRLGKDVAQELRSVLESFSIFQQYIYIYWLHLPDALNNHRKTHPLDPDKQQWNSPCRWRLKAPHASIRLRN